MVYQRDIHHRRSIRLKYYDYSKPGAYFITICSQNRDCLFGEIRDDKEVLNNAGLMAFQWFQELPNKFTNMQCDAFICMPNHIHFIVNILEIDTQISVGAHLGVHPDETTRQIETQGHEHPRKGQTRRSAPTNKDIPAIVQWYKTMTTNAYIRGVKQHGWKPFNGKLWQGNYWERIIRDENELSQIRKYIETNPMCWEQDKLFIAQNIK